MNLFVLGGFYEDILHIESDKIFAYTLSLITFILVLNYSKERRYRIPLASVHNRRMRIARKLSVRIPTHRCIEHERKTVCNEFFSFMTNSRPGVVIWNVNYTYSNKQTQYKHFCINFTWIVNPTLSKKMLGKSFKYSNLKMDPRNSGFHVFF